MLCPFHFMLQYLHVCCVYFLLTWSNSICVVSFPLYFAVTLCVFCIYFSLTWSNSICVVSFPLYVAVSPCVSCVYFSLTFSSSIFVISVCQQDCINLRNIKGNLQAGASEHSDLCEAKPEFSLSQKFGITNILMSCQV